MFHQSSLKSKPKLDGAIIQLLSITKNLSTTMDQILMKMKVAIVIVKVAKVRNPARKSQTAQMSRKTLWTVMLNLMQKLLLDPALPFHFG